MNKNIMGIVMGLLLWGCSSIQKSDLRILYVGGSADIDVTLGIQDTLAFQRSVSERMVSFENMLKEYFNTVEVIHARDYKPELSRGYDVTVMDGTPPVLVPMKKVTDETGRIIEYKRPGYLSEDFDCPVVTIGELGEVLGRRIGLKTDWYCLCLDAYAHHFRQNHPIFKGPFPVQMTVGMRPTPTDAFHYAYYADGAIPDSILMWQVQTKGYRTDKGFRIGMVARPWGFEDSPEAEYISSGECAKTLDAVAIGRHGNFLHWGFAASPQYMTSEAQAVLANAIVYIAQFAGQRPLARKFNDRIATRDYLKELKYLSTRQAYDEHLQTEQKFDSVMLEGRKKAVDKKAKGEKLIRSEESALNYKTSPSMPYADFVKRYQKELFEQFGTDEAAYAEYYQENYNYFYGGEGMYRLVVDEEVKSLGIANNDSRLLDIAISMLEKNTEVDKANRILTRYTLCRFSEPADWRKWYEENKNRFFFTEAGGWLFLVNTREPIIGNDYHIRDQQVTAVIPETAMTDENNPVQVAVGISPLSNGNQEVVIKLRIHPGYHIYADVAEGDSFIPTSVGVKLSGAYQIIGDLKKPSFKPFNKTGTTIYEDEILFCQEIKGSGKGSVKCNVEYQCCDAHICIPPVQKQFAIEIK